MYIDWYEHPDEEHTIHRVYYGSIGSAEPPLSPPEPEVVAWCARCDGECYTDAFDWNGKVVCPTCYEELKVEDGSVASIIDYLCHYPALLIEIIKDETDASDIGYAKEIAENAKLYPEFIVGGVSGEEKVPSYEDWLLPYSY